MSVLSQIIEKVSDLKEFSGNNDLKLEPVEHPFGLLLPDLQKYNVYSDKESYGMYLVTENSDSDGYKPSLIAALAGFYNARYVFEYLKHYEIKAPIGSYRFFIRKRYIDRSENVFVALVLRWPSSQHLPKSTLTLDEIKQVAEALSILHSRGFQQPESNSRDIVNENHKYVQEHLTNYLRHNFDHFLQILFHRNRPLFDNSERARRAIHDLYRSFSSFQDCSTLHDDLPKVLCHGSLCVQNLRFSCQNELTTILNWEHASFGHVALDLTYLMTNSLTTSDRQQNCLRVLRYYYYSLVDKHMVPFRLHDLKIFYRRFLKYAVFLNMLSLMFTLESTNEDASLKREAVERWEQVLYEAHQVETENYLSSNEDLRII